jgi:hypothetical protein
VDSVQTLCEFDSEDASRQERELFSTDLKAILELLQVRLASARQGDGA